MRLFVSNGFFLQLIVFLSKTFDCKLFNWSYQKQFELLDEEIIAKRF